MPILGVWIRRIGRCLVSHGVCLQGLRRVIGKRAPVGRYQAAYWLVAREAESTGKQNQRKRRRGMEVGMESTGTVGFAKFDVRGGVRVTLRFACISTGAGGPRWKSGLIPPNVRSRSALYALP